MVNSRFYGVSNKEDLSALLQLELKILKNIEKEKLKNTYRNGGYLKVLEGDRIQVDFKTSDNITIPKYTGTYKFEYAQTINNK